MKSRLVILSVLLCVQNAIAQTVLVQRFTGQGIPVAVPASGSPGSGTVTSVGMTVPSWLAVAGSPITTSGTLAVSAATGQTAGRVIGTCGAATSVSLCALVSGDLPTIPLSKLATQAADTVLVNATGGSAVPTAVAWPTTGTNGCAGTSDAIGYNTTTHAFVCNTISGSGSPAGSDTQVQINSMGSFGAVSGFTMASGILNVPSGYTTSAAATAGFFGCVQGTAITPNTNEVVIQCPTAVTAYAITLPGAVGSTGIVHNITSGSTSTWSFSQVVNADISSSAAIALSKLATQAADTVDMNATGGAAVPTAVAMPTSGTNGCAGAANALTYNTTTHAWGCNTISGSGTVNSATTNQVAYYTGSTAVSGDAGMTYDAANDVLTLVGGVASGSAPPSLTAGTGAADAYGEGTAPSVGIAAGVDVVYADSTRHGLLASYNNGTASILTRGPASSTSGNLPSFNGTNGDLFQDSGVAISNVRNRTIGCAMGDPTNASALTTSSVCYFHPTFSCTISKWSIGVDAGTATVKFWKVATGTALPTISNSINTSGVAISTGTAVDSSTVSDFTTTTVSALDWLAVQPTSIATAKWLLAELECDQ